jgi:hypothetical protein
LHQLRHVNFPRVRVGDSSEGEALNKREQAN